MARRFTSKDRTRAAERNECGGHQRRSKYCLNDTSVAATSAEASTAGMMSVAATSAEASTAEMMSVAANKAEWCGRGPKWRGTCKRERERKRERARRERERDEEWRGDEGGVEAEG